MSLSIYHIHTRSLGRMSEREVAGTRERLLLLGDHLTILVFTFGADSISEEVLGFSPLWFPQGKFFVSLVSCVLLLCMLFSQIRS